MHDAAEAWALDPLYDRFEEAISAGEPTRIEDVLHEVPESLRSTALHELLRIEWYWLEKRKVMPPLAEYESRFPEDRETVRLAYETHAAEQPTQGDLPHKTDPAAASAHPEGTSVAPERVGRYVVERLLGSGTFGEVWLGVDEQLNRRVAVKISKGNWLGHALRVSMFLEEAQTVAALDHEGIVPVYDVGQCDAGRPYVVSKYIDGQTLASWIRERRPTHKQSVAIVADLADALHYAHTRGLVHRDIKPDNVLLEKTGKAYLCDFGLSLREEHFGQNPMFVGTPSYMSPEQARGEGHLVDGRSDVYSLGGVLFELLTGHRPCTLKKNGAETTLELLRRVADHEPQSPRELDRTLSPELERITLKCLSKRASDRYSTAAELAADLRAFLAGPREPDARGVRVVPHGLRSFDEHDSDFFLELLPGARDRNGLPESLGFWKRQIEDRNPEKTFRVGVIYGPSGCGKSSLVKAGLVPRLADNVRPVYVEATDTGTERRLLTELQRECPDLAAERSLHTAIAQLRRGQSIRASRKVVLILDQFEQWLHAHHDYATTELARALRQCDGRHVQAIVLVRDDFWMAVSRLFRDIDIPLRERRNSGAVDLFDPGHARFVLAEFGRAYGRLPDSGEPLTRDQEQFLDEAMEELIDEGMVVPVKLALFTEMMKLRPWNSAAFRSIGGATGIGVAFLEQAFGSLTGHPEHRHDEPTARRLLRCLLPDAAQGIRGRMRSIEELREASGQATRPEDFNGLVRFLDSDLRLITPADAADADSDQHRDEVLQDQPRHYQLTHDYLVPSIRGWLNRKQQETRRGRAELKLEERATFWNARQENRYLPSALEWAEIQILTDSRTRTPPENKMLRRAGLVHGVRAGIGCLALIVVVAAGFTVRTRAQDSILSAETDQVVKSLLRAETSEVPRIVDDLTIRWQHAEPALQKIFRESPGDSRGKLHAGLALVSRDISVLPYLKRQLLLVDADQFAPVCGLLAEKKGELIEYYWEAAADGQTPAVRFRAGCALAGFDSNNTRWLDKNLQEFLAGYLVDVEPTELRSWLNELRPVMPHLTSALTSVFCDDAAGEVRQSLASTALLDHWSDRPDELFELLMTANERQFSAVFQRLSKHRETAIRLGQAELAQPPANDVPLEGKEAFALRKVAAAAMLFRLEVPDDAVWSLLKHSSDPSVRSFLIDGLAKRGINPEAIIARFRHEPDITIKRALLLCLGGFELPEAIRQPLIDDLLDTYRMDSDPGLHSATEWLLRRWNQRDRIAGIRDALQQTEQQLVAEQHPERRWYINSQHQTFVILDAGEFDMGSPPAEPGRQTEERLHRRSLNRRFAMATTEVTREQWQAFSEKFPGRIADGGHPDLDIFSPTADSSMIAVTWHEAALYCNWLSETEGVPEDQWCYDVVVVTGTEFRMDPKDNYSELTGYRLPTEAEWEFACRAGADTSWHYGDADSLLENYAWFIHVSDDHCHPVAELMPNDFGLFDMHGNAWEWSQVLYEEPPEWIGTAEPVPDSPLVASGDRRVIRIVRGGAANTYATSVRSASKNQYASGGDRQMSVGLRPVRTFP